MGLMALGGDRLSPIHCPYSLALVDATLRFIDILVHRHLGSSRSPLQRWIMKRLFWLVWLGFVVYAFGFAPPDQPDTFDLIQRLASGQWQGINPAVVALFNVMGLWPMIYGCLLVVDGRGQPVPAWPFAVASFAIGAFALLPYLGLRRPNPQMLGPSTRLLAVAESRWVGGAIALGAILLVGYGAIAGDWADFVQQWQTSRFIHVMSLDFCLLCSLVAALLGDDMARRDLRSPWIFWAVVLVPLLGIAVYLTLRPRLRTEAARSDATSTTAA